MLKNAENIALQSLQIFYTFVLRAEIYTTFAVKEIYTKNGKFCMPIFTTFPDQTHEFEFNVLTFRFIAAYGGIQSMMIQCLLPLSAVITHCSDGEIDVDRQGRR